MGVHGAGLSNAWFCRSGQARLLEILPPLCATSDYWKLAMAKGLRYDAFVADDPELERPDYATWAAPTGGVQQARRDRRRGGFGRVSRPQPRRRGLTGTPMKKLTLHIGRHKSGTSTIQSVLAGNETLLQEHGYRYPRSGRRGIAHHRLSEPLSRGRLKGGDHRAVWREPPRGARRGARRPRRARPDQLRSLPRTAIRASCRPRSMASTSGWRSTFGEQCSYLASAYAQKVQATPLRRNDRRVLPREFRGPTTSAFSGNGRPGSPTASSCVRSIGRGCTVRMSSSTSSPRSSGFPTPRWSLSTRLGTPTRVSAPGCSPTS